MGEITLDFRQATTFQKFGQSYIERIDGFTTLVYAIGKKVMPQIDKGVTEIREDARLEMEKKEYEFAEKDVKTEILLKNEDGTFKYTAENAKKLAEEKSKLNFPTKTIKIETYIPANFNTKTLTIMELLAFDGIVIPPLESPEHNNGAEQHSPNKEFAI